MSVITDEIIRRNNVEHWNDNVPALLDRIAELEAELVSHDTPGCWATPDEKRELQKRIKELEAFDKQLLAAFDKLRTAYRRNVDDLKAEYRWIPVSERLPCPEDGINGRVEVIGWNGIATIIHASLVTHDLHTFWRKMFKPEPPEDIAHGQ